MCNMISREALLIDLPENDYSRVKYLRLLVKIKKALEYTFEDDKHARNLRLQNWVCLFQEAKMMEDESIRSYFCRIPEIVSGIKACNRKKDGDEIV